MGEPIDEEVPGMATAVEARMDELGLTPTTFAAAAGLTYEGALPVRQGKRKNYAAKTRQGVARALAWPSDWYQRFVDGRGVEEMVKPPPAWVTLESLDERLRAIEADRSEMFRLLRKAAGEGPAAPDPSAQSPEGVRRETRA